MLCINNKDRYWCFARVTSNENEFNNYTAVCVIYIPVHKLLVLRSIEHNQRIAHLSRTQRRLKHKLV